MQLAHQQQHPWGQRGNWTWVRGRQRNIRADGEPGLCCLWTTAWQLVTYVGQPEQINNYITIGVNPGINWKLVLMSTWDPNNRQDRCWLCAEKGMWSAGLMLLLTGCWWCRQHSVIPPYEHDSVSANITTARIYWCIKKSLSSFNVPAPHTVIHRGEAAGTCSGKHPSDEWIHPLSLPWIHTPSGFCLPCPVPKEYQLNQGVCEIHQPVLGYAGDPEPVV